MSVAEKFDREQVGEQFAQPEFTDGYLRRLDDKHKDKDDFEWHVHAAGEQKQLMKRIKAGDIELVDTHVPFDGMRLKFLNRQFMKVGDGLVLSAESLKDVKHSVLHDFVLEEVCSKLNGPDKQMQSEESKQYKPRPLSILLLAGSGLFTPRPKVYAETDAGPQTTKGKEGTALCSDACGLHSVRQCVLRIG